MSVAVILRLAFLIGRDHQHGALALAHDLLTGIATKGKPKNRPHNSHSPSMI